MFNQNKYYQNHDASNVKQIKHPIIEKLQTRKQLAQQMFDMDVLDWLYQQDDETKRHINDMIRHAMALKMSSVNKTNMA